MFTVGHSTHTLDDFRGLLERHGVVSLADVRRHPGSRRMPWFSSESLGELGGRRPRRRDSPNTGWEVAAFGFERGIASLLALAPSVAIMCAEGNWWQSSSAR
jgi:hypothetical protein